MKSQRRAKGEGTIDKLPSGKWRARVTLDDGKRLSKTDERKDVVADWLRKTVDQAEKGLTYSGAKTTTGDYLLSWLSSMKNAVRSSTYGNYRNVIENHLIPLIGSILIKDLTPDRIQAAFDQLSETLGAPTRRKAFEALNRILDRARRTGLIIRNPCDTVVPPTFDQPEMLFWTEHEANAFLTAAVGSRLYALMHLALVTGAREGELLGLRWEDIDFGACTIRFRRQLTPSNKFAPMKTSNGRRTLMIGESNMAVLRKHYEDQQKERIFMGEKWKEQGFVFTSRKGTPVSRSYILPNEFHKIIEAAGIKRIRFHDLRHTCVAILFNKNTPVYKVSKWLGHSKTSITTDIYGHLLPEAFEGIGDAMYDSVSPVDVTQKYGHDKVTTISDIEIRE